MPANLPPQYYKLEREFKQERDPHEKLRLARELLAMMPKHKGTDKLQAELKAKISKLKEQVEGGGARHGAHRIDPFTHIDKEGAAQIILIGPPNSGKSSLVDSLTHAQPEIADYPFTTREPTTGMTTFDTLQFQLIDTPPISADRMEHYLPNLVRQADLVAMVLDVSSPEWDEGFQMVTRQLEGKRVILSPRVPVQTDDPHLLHKRTVIAAHKFLDEGGEAGLNQLRIRYSDFTVIPTSILEDASLEQFKAAIFGALDIIRVYTKRIGHEPDLHDPIILPVGGTVEDAAFSIHKDFARQMQFAKIWGKGKFEGQRVKNNYVLSDKDIIEFHI
jgi:ribosome-interacting GTPase 1